MKKVKVLIPIIILTVIIVILIILLNPSTRYKKITISQSKWDNIINSRTSSENLIIEDIRFNDYELVVDESDDTVYYSLMNGSKMRYNPKVSFIANEENTRLVALDDEITDEKVKSDYKFKIMIYNDSNYHIYNLVFTDFPILNITYSDTSKSNNVDMELYLFNNMDKTPNRITKSDGKLDILDNSNSSNDYRFRLFANSPREK